MDSAEPLPDWTIGCFFDKYATSGYGRMRPPARRHGEAFARDSLPRLLAAIPSLTERGSAMSASPLRADMVSVGIDVR